MSRKTSVNPIRSVSRRLAVLMGTLLVPLTGLATTGALPDWHLYGSNTLRGSLYGATGDAASGPYPFEGDLYYNEFNLYLNKRNSPYDRFRGEISGVYNLNDE